MLLDPYVIWMAQELYLPFFFTAAFAILICILLTIIDTTMLPLCINS